MQRHDIPRTVTNRTIIVGESSYTLHSPYVIAIPSVCVSPVVPLEVLLYIASTIFEIFDGEEYCNLEI